MTRAARHLAKSAQSENLTRLKWRPGQPLDVSIRQLRDADLELQLAEQVFEHLLAKEPPRPGRKARKAR
jgi:hypothetical protein